MRRLVLKGVLQLERERGLGGDERGLNNLRGLKRLRGLRSPMSEAPAEGGGEVEQCKGCNR